MDDKEFDDLMRKALSRRLQVRMPEDMVGRVMTGISHKVTRGLNYVKIAVSAAAMIAILMTMFVQSEQTSAPTFYQDVQNQTDLRIAEASMASGQIRDEVNNQYESLQSCCEN